MMGNLSKRLVIFRKHGLFDKHQSIGLQGFGQHLGHRLMYAAMKIHTNAKIRTRGHPDRIYPFYNLIHLMIAIDILHLFRGVHLNRSKAGLLLLQCRLPYIARPIPADPGVDANRIPAGSAKQLIDRSIVIFSLNVP
ncbi:hypothetical protein D3C77_356940 [compost metagenome]